MANYGLIMSGFAFLLVLVNQILFLSWIIAQTKLIKAMERITIELPTPIINALTAYTEGEQISSSDTIRTALESFLSATGYLSQPQKSFRLTPASQGSGDKDTSINHDAVLAEFTLSHKLPNIEP